MGNELIRPIDEDTARAIIEASKFGTKLLGTGEKAGSYTASIFGHIPHNLFGMVDDWLLNKRIRRFAELNAETRRILDERGVKEPYDEISPSVAVPLLEAAVDETRDSLKDCGRNF